MYRNKEGDRHSVLFVFLYHEQCDRQVTLFYATRNITLYKMKFYI